VLTEKQKLFVSRVIKAIKWRIDVDSGEMVEQVKDGEQYCKDHLSYAGSVSQIDLELIGDIVNSVFDKCDSNLMVGDSMGEILPGQSL